MEKMNSAVRHRAMAVRLTLSGNLLHPQAPHELTEPRGWGKLMEAAPRALVYFMWIPHQPYSVCRDPIARRGSSHRGPMDDPTARPVGSGLITETVGTRQQARPRNEGVFR
jgi:hypothetical protein